MAERTFNIEIEETTPDAVPRELRLTVSVEELTQPPQAGAKSWKPLKVGAGGWCTGMDVAPDGAMVTRTDTYGGYVWDGQEWQQLVSLETIPSATHGYGGIYELCIAPSDSNVLYMILTDALYRSDNRGKLWSKTAVTFKAQDANNPQRMYGQKMAVHPHDADCVIVGTQGDGLFVTRDGGKTSAKADVPVTAIGYTGIVFLSDGRTITLNAAEHGNYESRDGGLTFTHIGGPVHVRHAARDMNGDYLCTDGNALHRYNGSAWRSLYVTPGVFGLAVDPIRPGRILTCLDGGSTAESTDNGETWGGGQNWAYSCEAEDIPWLDASGQMNPYMSVGRLMFDPREENKVWMSAGVGVWYCATLPIATWHSRSAGIEQLCANDIVVPPGGKPALASWDRPLFIKEDLDAYEEAYLPTSVFSMGWSLDYASSDPGFLCGLVNYWGESNRFTGFTRDGTTWTPFPEQPPVNEAIGGSIAALTPDNILVAPANRQPAVYTKDGGKTWKPMVLPGLPDWGGFHWAYYLKRRTVAADRVKPNTAYVYAVAETDGFGALYETVDGGDTFTRVFDGHIVPVSYYNAQVLAMPGRAGELWFSAGATDQPPFQPMMRSTDAGRTWTKVEGIMQPSCFGFGAEGEVVTYAFDGDGKNLGIYRTADSGQTWDYLGLPLNRLDAIGCVAADPSVKGRVYVGFGGSGFAYYG